MMNRCDPKDIYLFVLKWGYVIEDCSYYNYGRYSVLLRDNRPGGGMLVIDLLPELPFPYEPDYMGRILDLSK